MKVADNKSMTFPVVCTSFEILMIDRPHLERHLWQVSERGVGEWVSEGVRESETLSVFPCERVGDFMRQWVTETIRVNKRVSVRERPNHCMPRFFCSQILTSHSLFFCSVHYSWRGAPHQEPQLPSSARAEEFQICFSPFTHWHSYPGMQQLILIVMKRPSLCSWVVLILYFNSNYYTVCRITAFFVFTNTCTSLSFLYILIVPQILQIPLEHSRRAVESAELLLAPSVRWSRSIPELVRIQKHRESNPGKGWSKWLRNYCFCFTFRLHYQVYSNTI